MDRPSHPLTEVIVVDAAFPLRVQILQDLDQVIVVKQVIPWIAKVPHNVLCRYFSIFVNIKIKESLPDWHPSVLKLLP